MIWYVHRNSGPGTPITSAHQDHMPGYNDEALDDANNAEIQAFLSNVRRSPPPPLARRIIALLVSKGLLSAQDQAGLGQ